MQYKTIVREILQQQPELYEQLLASHTLLPTMDRYAWWLRGDRLCFLFTLADHSARRLSLRHATAGNGDATRY